MHILYWNTCLTTDPEALFKHLKKFRQNIDNLDILCLNEATPKLVTLLKQDGWQVTFKPNSKRHGILIAAKAAIHKQRSYQLSSVIRKGAVSQKHLLLAEIEWGKKRLTVATTHLTYWRLKELKRRREERKVLLKYFQKTVQF